MSDNSVPWYSFLLLGLVLLAAGLIVWFTHTLFAPLALVLLVSILWGAFAGTLALHDFKLHPEKPWSKDSQTFDVWTIAHFGAGLVFGLWYVPIIWCVFLTFGWELFEILVKGFGDQEKWWNRAIDIGVALVGWLIVIVVLMVTAHAPFPLFLPMKK